jgi:hypothetical protein
MRYRYFPNSSAAAPENVIACEPAVFGGDPFVVLGNFA